MKTIFSRIAFLTFLAFSATLSLNAQYNPLGYWRFENPDARADASGNGWRIWVNQANLQLRNVSPIVGQYHHARDLPFTPGASDSIDNTSMNQAVTLELWLRITPGTWAGSVYWNNKCQLSFGDGYIAWDVNTLGGYRNLTVSLTGIGAADPYNMLDSTWHHVVAQYDACTGEQKIYVNGQSPPGFSRFHPSGMPVANGGNLHFTYSGGVDRLVGDIDEFAAYDTILPPLLVYQHYLEGLSGQPYNFNLSFAGPIPFPSPVQEGGFNPLEFAPGYPNVPTTPIQTFNQYPMPRYSVIDSIRPNMPWMADPEPFRYGGSPLPSLAESQTIFEQLAHSWNYYLYCGSMHGIYQYLHVLHVTNQPPNPNNYSQQIIESMSDNANLGLPRFIITNWGGARPLHLEPGRIPYAYINWQTLPDTFYIRNAMGAPQPMIFNFLRKNFAMANPLYTNDQRLDSLAFDGRVQRKYIDTLFQQLPANMRYMDMVGENDETQSVYSDTNRVLADVEIAADYANYTGGNNLEYQAERLNTMRSAYKEPFRDYIDSVNTGIGRDSLELWWYQMEGSRFIYDKVRPVVEFRDDRKRPCPYLYPNQPSRWRHGGGQFKSMDQLCQSIWYSTKEGDSLFIPAVSPGFNDFSYAVADVDMIRPGQFLGMLKGMTCMGADAYNIFMYHANSLPSQANWRIWQMPMLSYAQGITSRVQRFLYDGTMLVGDTTVTYHGSPPTFYTFSTGNNHDFITARKLHGADEYLISASAQRTSNMPSQAPHRKRVAFNLHENNGTPIYSPMIIEERLQGSTYILDNTNPSMPVFHQLDRWHEWKEPSHWCRDFDFEAEVWDSMNGAVEMFTERPLGVAAGDFTEFTTYMRWQNTASSLRYHFQPRGADQDSMYLWLRVRNNSLTTQFIKASVDGGALRNIPVGGNSGWVWVGIDDLSAPLLFSVLDTTLHVVTVQVGNTAIDLDLVTLKRSSANFSTQAFSVMATGQDVCLGDSTHFTGAVTQPAGCIDFQWEFGDGGMAYIQNPVHLYQYPGTYTVVFSAYHGCLDSLVTDTILVNVNAPFVDAGNDTLVCLSGMVMLQGDTASADTMWWHVNPALSSTTILNPIVTANASQYFYLTATDTSSGCSMTDSVRVTAIAMAPIVASPNDTICLGQLDTLRITGAFFVWWDADPSLSDSTIFNPIISPTVTTTYHWYASDACRCDTLEGFITETVNFFSLPAIIVTSDTGICRGDSLQLQGVPGAASYLWNNGGTLTATNVQSPIAFPIVTTSYVLNVRDAAGCPARDTVTVVVDNLPAITNATASQSLVCFGDTTVLTAMPIRPDVVYAWSPVSGLSSSSAQVVNAFPSATTTYQLVCTDTLTGCVGLDSVTIVVDSLPAIQVILTPDTTLCFGDTLQLNAIAGLASYAWNPGTGLSSASIANPLAWPSINTTYTLQVTNGNGCIGNDTVQIGRSIVSLAVSAMDTFICLGNTDTLLANGNFGGGTPVWTPNTWINTTSGAQVEVTPLASTWYMASVTDTFGCSATDSIFSKVDSLTLNFAIVPGDTTVCTGTSLNLATSNTGDFYDWSTMDVSPMISYLFNSTTTIWVEVKDIWGQSGCYARDTITVVADSFAVQAGILSPDTAICIGGSAQLLATAGAASYSWSPSGGLSSTSVYNPVATPTATTDYIVQMVDVNGCSATDTVRVSVDLTTPNATIITPDQLVCAGTTVTLQCSTVVGGNYFWQPPGGLSTPTVNVTPNTTTTYELIVTDGGTCFGRDSVTLTVQNCCSIPGVARYVRPQTASLPFSTVPANGGAVHIVDTLFVNSPSVSYSNKTFYMDSLAVIYVLPNCTLNTTNCTFQAACGDMWRDIYLPGLSSRFTSTNDTVRDALHGIWSKNGGAFAVNGTTFRANLIGIEVDSFAGATHPASIRGTKFLNGVLITPQPGQANSFAGINVVSVKGLTIGFPDVNATTENLFDGMVHGIHILTSSVNVYHNRFQNIVVAPNASGPLGTYCGVSAIGDITHPANNSLVVGHPSSTVALILNRHANTFTNCQDGIFVDKAMQVSARGNTFTSNVNDGIYVRRLRGNNLTLERNTFTNNNLGIYAGNSTDVVGSLTQNTITGNTTFFRYGIRMDLMQNVGAAQGVFPIQIKNNTIDLRGNGIFLNMNSNINVENNSVRVLRGNTTETIYGIFVGTNTRIRVANNPDIYSNGLGATNVKTAGIYVSRSPETSVICNGIHDVARSAVFVGDCRPSDFLSNAMRNGVDGFVMLDSARIGDQGRIAQVLPPYLPAKPCANSWQIGTFSNSCTNAINSIGNQSRFFVRNVPNQNPPPAMNKTNGNPLSRMTPQSVGNGFVVPVNCTSTIPGYENGGGVISIAQGRLQGGANVQAAQFRTDEWAFTALLKEPALIQSDPIIQSYHADLVGTSLAATCNSNEALVVPDSLQSMVTASLIAPLSQSEINHKTVLDIRLSDEELDSAEIQTLLTIASECEALGGKAVNIARGLLASEGIMIWDDPGCQRGLKTEENEGEGNASSSFVTAECWPNPTNNLISVRFNVASAKGQLSLYDAQGKLLATEGFQYEGQPLEVETGKWSQGLVVVKVDLQDGTQFKWRVVVQR